MSEPQTTLDDLKTLRDELRVQAHLAGKELNAFLGKQEARIGELRQRSRALLDDVKGHAPQVKAAARKLLDEIEAALDEARAKVGKG